MSVKFASGILCVNISTGISQKLVQETIAQLKEPTELPPVLKIKGSMTAAQAMTVVGYAINRVVAIALFDESQEAYLVVSSSSQKYQVGEYID